MIARVYTAINAVAAALAEDGVAKTRFNARDQYLYRSIDDVLERLAPLLAHHRLCILPRVLERHAGDRLDESGALLVAVSLKVAFDLVSAKDGSCHTIEAYGEALDAGDKATPKAMQSAYKYAVLQAFCVPAVQQEDADARSYRLQAIPSASIHPVAEPSQGWQGWCDELVGAVNACRDPQALVKLRDDHRPQLAALQRESPPLYRQVGEAIAARSRELDREAGVPAEEKRSETTAHLAPTAAPPSSIAQPAPSKAQSRGGEMAQGARGDAASKDKVAQPPRPSAPAEETAGSSPGGSSRPSQPKRRTAALPSRAPAKTRPNGSGAHG